MNKQQIFLQAKRLIDERRFSAEDKCENLLSTLRDNSQWVEIEHGLRQAEIDFVMGTSAKQKDAKNLISDYKVKQKLFLKKLGISEKDLKPKYVCKKCNDTGFVNDKPCDCLEAEIRKLIIAESNITNKSFTFENSTETNKQNRRVYSMAKNICIDGDSNILLIGNTGSGKTYLLTACANLCVELSKSVLFVTAYTLNGILLNAHLSDNATNRAILDSLVDVDVLAIDDLGTENVYKNVTAEYFFSVLNERIARQKQTFISTNLTLNDIRERYDERIFSRLVDHNTTFVAQLIGNDKRVKKD